MRAYVTGGTGFVGSNIVKVFAGTQSGADEDTPPNPVNLYGVLKMASEQAAMLSAGRAAVARVSAVSGMHWMRDSTPRVQDGGFGYFVTSIPDIRELLIRFRRERATGTLAAA